MGRGIFLFREIYRGRFGSFIDYKGPMGLKGATAPTAGTAKHERIGRQNITNCRPLTNTERGETIPPNAYLTIRKVRSRSHHLLAYVVRLQCNPLPEMKGKLTTFQSQ